MENENIKASSMPKFFETEVNEKETMEKLQPCVVQIMDFRIEDVPQYGEKVIVLCQHPDVKDKLIEISKVKYLQENALKTSGLWAKIDKDGKFPKNSAIGRMLAHIKTKNLTQSRGVNVPTELDENGYLAIKAY